MIPLVMVKKGQRFPQRARDVHDVEVPWNGKTLKGTYYVDGGDVHVRTTDGRRKWVSVGGLSEQSAAEIALQELGPPPEAGGGSKRE